MPENFNGHSFDVPGTFDERLTVGAARLEQEAAVRSPAGVRARGDQRRRRHTATLAVAPVLVLAIAGAAGLTLRPSGGSSRHDPGSAPPTSIVQTSPGGTTPTAPTTPATTTTTSTTSPAAATVTVNLGQHTMTVHDAQGKVLRTLPITAGKPGYATKTGTFTVADKKQTTKIYSAAGDFNTTVADYIDLGPHAPAIYAASWAQDFIGKTDTTHGDIGLNVGDAAWLYNQLAVGKTIQIEGDAAH